jgi:hypothetical protein
MTGSTTIGPMAWRRTARATASIPAAVASIPVLAAATVMSEATASIWASTSAGSTADHARTPWVF